MGRLAEPGITLLARASLRGSGATHLVHLRARTFVEVDPAQHSELAGALGGSDRSTNLSADAIRQVLPAERILSAHQGLVYHLKPSRRNLRQPDPSIVLRALRHADQQALSALSARCEPAEVDDAYVEATHEIVFGCHGGKRLLSAGSAYRRNGFLDIGVFTDPACRGRRLAPIVVAAISLECARRHWIAQYRCDLENQASRRVAEQVGFTKMFDSESLDVRPQSVTRSGERPQPRGPRGSSCATCLSAGSARDVSTALASSGTRPVRGLPGSRAPLEGTGEEAGSDRSRDRWSVEYNRASREGLSGPLN